MTNSIRTTSQVVHLDFIALADNATDAAIEELIDEAAGLRALESVRAVGVIRGEEEPQKQQRSKSPEVETPSMGSPSRFDLAFFFVLNGFADLEPFGTHPRYIRFLQGKVARLLKGFAGADVALNEPFPEGGAYAACLALAAPDETYDWEVRDALDGWAGDGSAAVGLAIGERQRYRGCVLRFTDTYETPDALADRRFETALIVGLVRRL